MDERRRGLLAGLLSNILWGVLPIYWHALRPIDSMVIIFYRVFLCAVSSWILARSRYSKEELYAPFKDKKLLLKFFLAGALITVNWSVYIWAVNADQVIATLEYYDIPSVKRIRGSGQYIGILMGHMTTHEIDVYVAEEAVDRAVA